MRIVLINGSRVRVQNRFSRKAMRGSANFTGQYNVRADKQVNAKANDKVNANGHRHFEDFGDVDPEEVVPLSLTIMRDCDLLSRWANWLDCATV
jgi:hypothetical protein